MTIKRFTTIAVATAALFVSLVATENSNMTAHQTPADTVTTEADATRAISHSTSAATATVAHMSYGFKTGASSSTPATYRWASKTITYKVNDKSTYYKQVWNSAVKHWNATKVIKMVPVQSGKTADITLASANSDTKKTSGDIVGLTYTSYHTTQTMGDLNVMASAKSYVYKNIANKMHYSQLDREHVAEHEIGHALGLEHAETKKSVMYYANRSSAITSTDIKGLKNAYNNNN
ncbi:matrixin family metalloprotease [Secundilactobacillus paracollinoides]|uniref:Peptidase metallopeptidase domain-containing protein n=1 Tax=Secundilactobacillus paracollinoides TaxID=240427 RepID=A0A1B2J1Z1_9LACO|nr:matrixin family metalloprotease [Secundilactobacillus paracollinoides]ANZ62342.1 hypothetical protein AYR61_14055 [Secundilactobacillus paracollinoides]ANZ68290.1 hypothetical protein AYR63_14930 [Secundilactobacillus paracollinoides]